MRIWRPVLPHLWMMIAPSPDMPVLCSEGFHVPPPDLPDTSTFDTTNAQRSPSKVETWSLHLRCATANVGSLSQGPAGYAGKLNFLRAQMNSHQLHIMGIQESRTSETFSHADGFIRIASGSERGNYGTEIWIASQLAVGTRRRSEVCIKPDHCTVVSKSPQHLLVHVVNDLLDLWLLSAHGPHSGHEEEVRHQWWTDLAQHLEVIPEAAHLITFLDANARTGPADNVHVFHWDDECTVNTSLFRDFLKALQLCVPSTGARHEGEHCTWTTPDGLHSQRIDYVCIPRHMLQYVRSSHVLQDFDMGNLSFDHKAVGLQMEWQVQLSLPPPVQKPQFARDKIKTSQFDEDMVQFCPSSWQTPVDQQVQDLNRQTLDILQKHCPREATKPKKPYVDPETWQLRLRRNQYKKQYNLIGQALKRETMWKAWKALCQKAPTEEESLAIDRYRCSLYRELQTAGGSGFQARRQPPSPSTSTSQEHSHDHGIGSAFS